MSVERLWGNADRRPRLHVRYAGILVETRRHPQGVWQRAASIEAAIHDLTDGFRTEAVIIMEPAA